MESIIEQMFLRCFRDSCFEQAIGKYHMCCTVRAVRDIEVEGRELFYLNYTCLTVESSRCFFIFILFNSLPTPLSLLLPHFHHK
jgi:hypothetical protein